MGRDLEWYVLDTKEWGKHDSTKKLCFHWDVQPDEEDVQLDVASRMDTSESKIWSYIHDREHVSLWCPTCITFARGLYASPFIKAKKNVHHSYSNPIWSSEWNIKDMYLGSCGTPFIRQFRSNNMYSEIEKKHITYSLERLEELGAPKRTSDKEAYEETMEVLEFLKDWASQPDTVIVFEDEF